MLGFDEMTDPIAYKVLRAEELARLEADGRFEGAPIDIADGYIHMSTAAQLAETIDKHFAGQGGLAVAAIDLTMLADAVRWEPSRGGQLFPHLYTVLPLSAVLAYGPLERDEDGTVRLPVAG
jgi:uncharacterized protein (DUF952 family)